MRYRIRQIFLAISLSLISLYLGAQSREGARKQMNQGNYVNACKILDGLELTYPGQYTNDLRIAQKCLELQRSAKAKFKAQHFSEAESLYKQILELNPNDRDAQRAIIQCQEERNKFWAAEYAKCETISDFREFAQRYPNAPQAMTAKSKVNVYDLIQQDNNAWSIASSAGTISSYTTYISEANSLAAHLGEAYLNRARLYYKEAGNAATDGYMYLNYSWAKKDYDKAKEYNLISLLNEDNNKYNICLAEGKYHSLESSPSYELVSSYLSWASSFQTDSFVSPHLHLERVYSMLVDAYCRSGLFNEARDVVEQYYGQMTSSFFTTNTTKEWSKKEWKKHIQAREKQYKKQHTKNTPINITDLSNKTPLRLPITWGIMGIEKLYNQVGLGLSFGDYYDKLNLDIMATALLSDYQNDRRCILSIAPTYNIIDMSKGYHFNVQPLIGFDTKQALVFGARAGIGWKYTDFSIGTSYENGLGVMADFKLRVNINLVGRD